MKRILVYGTVLLLLFACSSDQDQEEKTGKIEQATKEVATEMVEHIQKPIDKAQAVKSIEEERNKQFEKAAE